MAIISSSWPMITLHVNGLTETASQRMNICLLGEGWQGRDRLRLGDRHVHSAIFKVDNQRGSIVKKWTK